MDAHTARTLASSGAFSCFRRCLGVGRARYRIFAEEQPAALMPEHGQRLRSRCYHGFMPPHQRRLPATFGLLNLAGLLLFAYGVYGVTQMFASAADYTANKTASWVV